MKLPDGSTGGPTQVLLATLLAISLVWLWRSRAAFDLKAAALATRAVAKSVGLLLVQLALDVMVMKRAIAETHEIAAVQTVKLIAAKHPSPLSRHAKQFSLF